jgi:hypothetical protein
VASVQTGPAHPDPAQLTRVRPSIQVAAEKRVSAAPAQDLEPVVPDRVELRVGEREVHANPAPIAQPPEEDGHRQAGDSVVGRREGAEGLELHVDWQN